MTTLTAEGDGTAGKRIVHLARKAEGPYLARKSGRHGVSRASSTTPRHTWTLR